MVIIHIKTVPAKNSTVPTSYKTVPTLPNIKNLSENTIYCIKKYNYIYTNYTFSLETNLIRNLIYRFAFCGCTWIYSTQK